MVNTSCTVIIFPNIPIPLIDKHYLVHHFYRSPNSSKPHMNISPYDDFAQQVDLCDYDVNWAHIGANHLVEVKFSGFQVDKTRFDVFTGRELIEAFIDKYSSICNYIDNDQNLLQTHYDWYVGQQDRKSLALSFDDWYDNIYQPAEPDTQRDRMVVVVKFQNDGFKSKSGSYWMLDTLVWQMITDGTYNDLITGIWIKKLPRRPVGGARKRMITALKPIDNACMQRALVMIYLWKTQFSRYKSLNTESVNDTTSKEYYELSDLVSHLSSEVKVDVAIPTGYDEALKFATWLSKQHSDENNEKNVVIYCFNGDQPNLPLMWRTSNDTKVLSSESTEFYDLRFRDAHYTPLTHIHRLLGNQRHYCRLCCRTYDRKNSHRCRGPLKPSGIYWCMLCWSKDKDHLTCWKRDGSPKSTQVLCETCNRMFPSRACYLAHKKNKISRSRKMTICQSKWRCTSCNITFGTPHRPGYVNKLIVSREDHVCGQVWCNGCKSFQNAAHTCFLQPDVYKKQDTRVWYYDFETVLSPTMQHIPVLCVVQESTSDTQQTYWDINELCAWMLKNPGTYIAHNSRAFDAHLLLNVFVHWPTPLKFNFVAGSGTKILDVRISSGKRCTAKNSIRLIDSLSFLPFALSKFSKTFNLPTTKGFFPYTFAKPDNLDYKGTIPEQSFFDVHRMDTLRRKSFDEWYNEQKANEYDLKSELHKYCCDDVKLLKEGCEIFRNSFITAGGIDPFTKCTIAGACNTVFKVSHLLTNSLELITNKTESFLRRGFVGGRTEPFKLYYKAQPDEKIQYVDYCSLYPWVNKYCNYPIGVHRKYVYGPDGTNDIDQDVKLTDPGLGIWEVDIQPPEQLYVPLLHSKVDVGGSVKLFFDLRAKKKQQYTTPELKKALEVGYVITRVYTKFHWPQVSKGFGGSASYINKFLKLKQESSGWPASAKTLSEKKKYVNDYKTHEDIDLDPENIAYNPGLRLVAKLCCNSLWGRQGMRPSECYTETSLLYDTAEGSRALNELGTRISDYHILSDRCVLFVSKGTKSKDNELAAATSIVSAIFTTAWARLKLYNDLYKLNTRVLYCDTDSIIFIDRPGAWKPVLGRYLGDLTNEIGSDDYSYNETWGTEFVSTASKSYALKFNEQKIGITKVKGHNLKAFGVSSTINFEALKQIVYNPHKSYEVAYDEIKRSRTFKISSINSKKKKFGWTFDKRVVLRSLNRDWIIDTVPHK